ncbi:MAG: DUF5711 family protein [Oscillospiraceae bacterium]|jgi:hypothetical protein|nr:DUF5711 family protein [Oscillospiraceae bacterium]
MSQTDLEKTKIMPRDLPNAPMAQADRSDGVPAKKSKKKRRKKRHWFGFLMLIAAALVTTICLIVTAGVVGRSNMMDFLNAFARHGDGFPKEISYNALRKASLLNDDILLVSDSNLQVLSPSGYQKSKTDLVYHAPSVQPCNGRVLVFDRTLARVSIYGKTAFLANIDLDQPPFCAALNAKGEVAVATRGDTFNCEVRIFNTKQNPTFAWNCANEYAADMALGGTGKNLFLCLLGTEKAGVYSRLVLLDTEKKEPVSIDIRLNNEWITRVYAVGDGWYCVGDTSVYLVRKDGTKTAFSYDGRSLLESAADGSYFAVLLQDLNKQGTVLRVYQKNGEKALEKTFAGTMESLQINSGKLYLMGETFVFRWTKKQTHQSQSLPEGTQKTLVRGNRIYALTSGEILQIDANWSNTKQNAS